MLHPLLQWRFIGVELAHIGCMSGGGMEPKGSVPLLLGYDASMSRQEILFLTGVLKPFILVALFVLIVWPITKIVDILLPDGKLKRALFRKLN